MITARGTTAFATTLLAAVGTGLAAFPGAAHAACILDQRWTVPDGPVPVYLSFDGLNGTNLGNTDLGDDGSADIDAEILWVKTVIDMINSASADSPRLYYAGLDGQVADTDTTTYNPNAITVGTWRHCSAEPDGRYASQDVVNSGQSCRIRMIRGGEYTCNSGEPDPGAHLWWVDPAGSVNPDGSERDFMGTLGHEMLHCLGLGHTDPDDEALCDENYAYYPAFASVMRTDSGMHNFRRRLRRDDVEGLRLLYGEPERTPRWQYSTTAPPTSGSWTDGGNIHANLRTNTPVGLSSAAHSGMNNIGAGFTNNADEVRYFTGSGLSWTNANGGTQIQTGGGAAVYSYDAVSAARGYVGLELRSNYGWIGGPSSSCCGEETLDDWELRVRWRAYANGSWKTHGATAQTLYKNVGLGYDPTRDYFVLAYVDTYPSANLVSDQRLFVRTINAATGGGGCTQALTTVNHILGVGDIACDGAATTRCVIPVSTSTADGPLLQYIQGDITDYAGYTCFVRTALPNPPLTMAGVYSFGGLSSAFDNVAAQGTMLGGYVPGFAGTTPGASGYAYVYTMNRNFLDLLSGTMANSATFTADYWPLRVGSLSDVAVQFRVVNY